MRINAGYEKREFCENVKQRNVSWVSPNKKNGSKELFWKSMKWDACVGGIYQTLRKFFEQCNSEHNLQ